MATIRLFNTSGAIREDLLDIIKDVQPDNSPLSALFHSGVSQSSTTVAWTGTFGTNNWNTSSTSTVSEVLEQVKADPTLKHKPNRLKEWLEAHRK